MPNQYVMDISYQKIITDKLTSISSGDKDLETELIEIFLEQIPQFISNLKMFYKNNDWKNLAKEAHSAKSSAYIFELQDTGKLLQELELLADREETAKFQELIESIETGLNNASVQLQNIRSNLK